MTIIDIVEQIFTNNDFEFEKMSIQSRINEASYLGKPRTSNQHQQYFYVINIESFESSRNMRHILEQQRHLLDDFINYLKDQEDGMLKVEWKQNSYLLICIKVDNIRDIDSKIKDDILFLEEDKYFFRKLVLTYDDASVKILSQGCDDDQIKNEAMTDKIARIINDTGYFESFCKKSDRGRLYALVANLYIKISFLKLPLSTNKNENKEHVKDDIKTIIGDCMPQMESITQMILGKNFLDNGDIGIKANSVAKLSMLFDTNDKLGDHSNKISEAYKQIIEQADQNFESINSESLNQLQLLNDSLKQLNDILEYNPENL